jgi:hypothetical protein
MSGSGNGRRRNRLGLGAAVVLILTVAVIAAAKSSASNSNTPLKAVGRAIDVSSAPRKFQFIGQGRLQGGNSDTLLIGNLPVVINAQTQFVGSIRPGEMVSLSGSILADKSWLVDRIEPVSDSETYFIFAGPLEDTSDKVWEVGGMSVLINSATVIDPDLKVQDMLLVTFSVQEDGSWLASKIESLQNNQGVMPPTETPMPADTSVAPAVPVNPSLQPVSPNKPNPKDSGDGNGKGRDNGRGKGHDKGGGKGRGK